LENNHNIWIPRANLIGVGAIKDLSNELLPWKLSKALIVTDKNIISLGYVEIVEKILDNLFIFHNIFDGVLHPNPTVSFVEDGLACCDNSLLDVKRDYDLIISIGGGTNHDCAKGIAIILTNGGSISDYEGWNKVAKPPVPHIAINTTSGAGSENTMCAIITDESRQVKMDIFSPLITPAIAVNDPMFMATMPKEVTASSGIDVIAHALEAFMGTEASPISDALAIKALKLAMEYLPRAYENGNDMEAREQMMFACIMAAVAFNTAGLGYIHAISHQLGGFYNTTHGNINAVLLPYIVEFNALSLPDDRIMKICRAMNLNAANKTHGVDLIVKSLMALSTNLGIPSHLKDMGLESEDIEALSRNALKDIAGLTNPRKGDLQDVMNIMNQAL
jgi:Alcohol dehydrogenase, class IV